jgi:DNA-binding NtrC family response regulator
MNLDALILVSPRNGSSVRDSSKPSDLIHARRILIAEDEEIIRWIISNTLADDGYAVNAAADGEQAWEALRHDSYDLLVTDNEMPRLTGVKLIERIRQSGMSLPVIVASGSFSVESVRDYPQLQIAAVIPKPFDKLEFLDTVRNVLSSNEDAITNHTPLDRSHAGPLAILQRNELNPKLCRHRNGR